MPYAKYHKKEKEKEGYLRRKSRGMIKNYYIPKRDKKFWNKGIYHPLYGKHHSEETKKLLKEKHKGKHHSVATEFKKGHKMSKELIERFKIRRAKQIIPKRDTSIEIKIQEFLKNLGIEFFTHFYVKEIEHAYRCDIFIPSMKMVIECDGDYWHGNPNIFSDNDLKERQIQQRELDKSRNRELIEKGFKVLRLWGSEIKKMEIYDLKNILKGGIIYLNK